jgi:hypothetical protein
MTIPALDFGSVCLLVGGLLGGLCRALLGTQKTLSRRTVLDVLMGAAVAVIVPAFADRLFALKLSGEGALAYLSGGFLIGGFGNYIIVAILWRVGVFKQDARADAPENGDKK